MTQAKIAARAAELSRRIYASLPFEYRVARLLIQLNIAATTEEDYGRVFYAEFIKAGVQGMPPIGKMPAEEIRDKLIRAKSRAANLLPEGYGGAFGRSLWSMTKRAVGSDSVVKDIMQELTLSFFSKGTKGLESSFDRDQAESFVKWRLSKKIQDYKKSFRRKRQPERSLTDPVTQLQIDLMDRSALQKFVQLLGHGSRGERQLLQALRDVDKAHPNRAWSWIEGQLAGRTNRELAEEWGVVPSMVTQWIQAHKSAIQEAFLEVGLGEGERSGVV